MTKGLKVKIENKIFNATPEVKALGRVEFEIKPQEFVSILGPSGCGKSTLLRLMVGLDTDINGEILMGDRVVTGPEKSCGIVFQEPRLLPWTSVRENIRFGIYADKNDGEDVEAKITAVLKVLDLHQFIDSYPSQLSGGMAQRAALARTLINLPEVLLLDEPFGALDELTKRRLQEELQRILQKEKTTALMVTHDIEEAVYLSDRILIMSRRPGEIVKTFGVTLPKPRKRIDPNFMEFYRNILEYMQNELKLF